MSSVRILIVEDDADHGRSLQEAISDLGYEVEVAATGEAGIEAFRARGADVVLTDLVLPDVDGIAVMQRIRTLGAAPVILMTAYASIDTSVRAIREGAYDYLQKPLDIDELQTKLERALEAARLRRQVEQLSAEVRGKWSAHGWVAESPVMREVVRQTLALADTNATVLIRGASGTGKELVARALHADGPRANGPFVAVNCAAFAESLLESELFGHEKGAFTGATERRRGRFELADGGTLFLDEIGEIDPALQVKILRVLEERRFERVGGTETIEVDVRLVTATNRDLRQQVAEGKFREDLFYRLFVVNVTLPPLREREGDIVLLARHYLQELAAENGKTITGITPEAMDALTAYSWPGNVRELRNVIERMVVLSNGEKLTVRDLPAALRGPARAAAPRSGSALRDAERQMIIDALRRHKNNRTRAAQELGIHRRTLHRKLNEYGLRESPKE